MSITQNLIIRSGNMCELCSNADSPLVGYIVPPKKDELPDNQVVLCEKCHHAITSSDYNDLNHWRCLTGSIWSEFPSVQALSYRILNTLKKEDWAAETLTTVFVEESVIDWANAEASLLIHKDAYGNILQTGDTVLLIENVNVKGTSYTATKGTIIRKIKLVKDNEEQIEGKINGDTIVILTKFLKRSF